MGKSNPPETLAKPALLAAVLGPIQNVSGWAIAGALWPGYDPVTKTISDLAADDSPVKWVQSSFFLLGTALTFVVAFYVRAIATPGRIVIGLAGVASLGLTIFSTPSQDGYSIPHRVFASCAFLLFSIWPLFGMRFDRSYHWTLRPPGAILATAVIGIATIWFLLTWLEPEQSLVGVSERLIVFLQTAWMSVVILSHHRHVARLSPK